MSVSSFIKDFLGGGKGVVNRQIDTYVDTAIAAADIVTYDPVTGQILDAATPISGIASMTFAQMEALTADQLLALAGLPVHISDVHTNSSGIGGVYVVRDSSPAGWAAIGGPWYYATFATVPAVGTIKNLQVVCGDVGYGLVTLRDDGTRYRPVGRSCVLAGASYGTIASPTNTVSAGTSGYFSIATPTFPAGLFDSGDRLRLTMRGLKTGTAATMYFIANIGTAGTVSDSTIWDATIANVTATQFNAEVVLFIGSDTTYTTNGGFVMAGTGSAPAAYDRTTNFNVASEMILSISVGTKNASDSGSLLGYSLTWEA